MNKQQSSTSKTTIIFIIVLVIGALIYFYTNGNPSDNNVSSIEVSGDPQSLLSDSVGARALTLLNQVNSLKIDANVFNSEVYKSLVDYSVEIPPQNIGRVNPFLPFRAVTPIVIPSKNNTTKSR